MLNDYNTLNPFLIKADNINIVNQYLSCSGDKSLIDENLRCLIKTIKQKSTWCVLYWHQIDAQDQVVFDRVLSSLIDTGIWIDTIGKVVRYMIENSSSSINVLSENNSCSEINVTHSLDQSIYNVPLTIRSSVPQSWAEVQINQNNNVQIVQPVMEGDGATVYYNIIPNAGLVKLTPANQLAPAISQTPNSIVVSSEQGKNASDQTFQIWNSGGENLEYIISVDSNWLSCSPENGNSEGEKDTISVTFYTAAMDTGTYFANIKIINNAAKNSPQTIPVTLIIDFISDDEDRDGFTEDQGDCDDSDNTVYPGAPEICDDGIDQDCDGNDLNCEPNPLDADNDGDGFTENQGDCEDSDNTVYPGAPEICGDGIDQDCDTKDEECLNDDNNSNGGGCFISQSSK